MSYDNFKTIELNVWEFVQLKIMLEEEMANKKRTAHYMRKADFDVTPFNQDIVRIEAFYNKLVKE